VHSSAVETLLQEKTTNVKIPIDSFPLLEISLQEGRNTISWETREGEKASLTSPAKEVKEAYLDGQRMLGRRERAEARRQTEKGKNRAATVREQYQEAEYSIP